MQTLPKARTGNLLEQNLKDETLIYDLAVDKAFNLNETSTVIYKACDGQTTFDELKNLHKFSDEFIYLALDELKRNNLLVDKYVSPFAATSRREVIKKVGLASMMVLPIITGLVAPTAANAASGASGGSGLRDDLVGVYGGACYQGGSCAPEYKCAPTSSGMRCCVGINSGGGGRLLLPGEDSSETYRDLGTYYTSQPASYACPASTCCSGGGVSGDCSYEIDPNQDPDELAYLQANNDPRRPYILTCNCSCS